MQSQPTIPKNKIYALLVSYRLHVPIANQIPTLYYHHDYSTLGTKFFDSCQVQKQATPNPNEYPYLNDESLDLDIVEEYSIL